MQQRRKLVLEYLRDAVAEVTRIDASEIREEAGFFDLGMDSLMAVELRRRLEQAVGKELPATLAMDYPRLSDVADYLLGDVLQPQRTSGQPERRPQPASLATSAADEPIAIIAVACRFPGSPDPDAYWDVLSGGVDAIREIPEDRFDVDEFYDPDQQTPGKIYTRSGGYLDSVDGFDPEFFGISPREAVWMDPQQRLMLEIAWEGLERAGYAPASLRGSRTGVFVGVAANEYSHLLSSDSVENLEAHFITGNALNAIAGRVAFTLGLEGPAMAVDTACSSSLVAVHQASQALHSGDCDMALAGGVNVLLSPASIVAASRARMLAPDGRCKTFDAAADGYARGEGCGVLVLKRLSDAQRDGDRICAVIRSSAVNQDGASSGLTVPNGGAQQRLIAAALARAGLTGADVDYLEAHGTGTPLGDPIEVQAAAAVYGAGRDPNRPLLMGTAKTNIGHLESAAGVAGLIKVVLSLQHELLPQTLHFHNPSPHIPWDSLPVQVVDKPTPWHANGRPRRAGVSSFGFTGTNAHVLIEEAPQTPAADDLPTTCRRRVGVRAAARAVERAAAVRAVRPGPGGVGAALLRLAGGAPRRLDRRRVLHRRGGTFPLRAPRRVGRQLGPRGQMLLDDLVAGRLRPGVLRGECTDPPTTAWFFPGQGSQYPGMARELFDTEPVFAETVRRCAQAVDPMLPRPLLDVLLSTDREAAETLRHTSFAQPAIFAVEMGLARLWQSWGIEPDVVLGHSVGQYAAACVAGVFSLEDGARLIAERGRLFGSLPRGRPDGGGVRRPRLRRARRRPRSRGFRSAPTTAATRCCRVPARIWSRSSPPAARTGRAAPGWRPVHAFHSELLDPVLDEFESFAAQFDYAVPTLPLVCNRTGAVLTAETPMDAPVLAQAFPPAGAVHRERAHRGGPGLLGADGDRPAADPDRGRAADLARVLGYAARDRVAAQGRQRTAADHRGACHLLHLRAPAGLRRHGPHTGAAGSNCRPIRSSAAATGPRPPVIRTDGTAVSGILGSAKDLASGDTVYTNVLSVKTQPWLAHHVIYGTVVVPGATYATMALAAAGAPARVKDVFFYEPIILPEKASREVQLTMHPLESGGGWKFQVHSRPYGVRDAEWSLNADGSVLTGADDATHRAGRTAPASPWTRPIEQLNRTSPQQLFETFNDMELAWGPTWSTSLKSLWVGDGEAIGDVVRRRRTGRASGQRADPPGAARPVHRRGLPGLPGVARRRARGGRSVPAAAVRAGGVARADAAAVLLPGTLARRRRSTAKPRSSTSISSTATATAWAASASSPSSARPVRRCCAGSAATPPGCCTPWAGTRPPAPGCATTTADNAERHLADRRIRRAGHRAARALSRSIRPPIGRPGSRRSPTPPTAARPSPGSSGAAPRQPGADESTADLAARLEAEIGSPARRRADRAGRGEAATWPAGCGSSPSGRWRPNPASRSTRCRQRCGDSGAPSSPSSRPCAAGWWTCDASEESASWLAGALGTPVAEPEIAVRQGQVPGATAAALGAQRPAADAPLATTTSWHRPNAARSTICA